MGTYSYNSGYPAFNSAYPGAPPPAGQPPPQSYQQNSQWRPNNTMPVNGPSLQSQSASGDTFVRRTGSGDPNKPDLIFKSFNDLTPEYVNSKGAISGMVFDIDDTLSKYKLGNDRTIPPELKQQLKILQDGNNKFGGIKLGIISNNPDGELIQQFQKELADAGIQVAAISNGQKPGTESLEMMQQAMGGLPADQIMMVGDNPDTDIASGKKAGFKTGQADWFGTGTLRKEFMQVGDKAMSFIEDVKGAFDSDADRPQFHPPPPLTPTVNVVA